MMIERYIPEEHLSHGIDRYLSKMSRYRSFMRLFNVRMDSVTRVSWAELMMLARSVDNFVDGSSSEYQAKDCELEVLKFFDEGLNPPFYNLMGLDRNRMNTLKVKTSHIFELGREYKQATTVGEYAVARAEEGRVFASMFNVACEDETKSQPGFESFWNVFERCAVASNFVNSAIGAGVDFESGQSKLEPSLGNRFELVLTSLRLGLFSGSAVDEAQSLS